MALHTMYNFEYWSQIMEPDFSIVGLVRQPLAQFQSMMNYYNLLRGVTDKFPNVSNPDALDYFLSHVDQFYDQNNQPTIRVSLLITK